MKHTIHNLAEKYEKDIKDVVTKRFSESADNLVPLINKKNGVYISGEDPSTLCCMVVGKKSKYLYLVTAYRNEKKETLTADSFMKVHTLQNFFETFGTIDVYEY